MIRPYFSRAQLTPDHLVALLLTLAPLAYFFPAVRGAIVLCADDGIIFNTPIRVAAAQIARAGNLPLWNPYIFSGMPLFAGAQVGVLFPLNWFYLIFAPALATNLMVVSTYMVAALGAYLYARQAGMSVPGAAATSLVWQWSGFMVGQITHINIVQTAAMLPWVLFTLDAYGHGRGRKWALFLSICVALQAFVGHQQMFAYSLLLTGAYALVMALIVPEARRRYLHALVFIFAGLLLAAVQILPTFELLRNSVRAKSSYDFFTSFSLPRSFAATFFAPYVLGGGDGRLFRAPYLSAPFYTEYIGYVGLLAIMLSICVLLLKRDAQTKFWSAVAAICFVLALGNHSPIPVYRIIYHAPILNLFRVPARHLMEVDFALAVLTGWGITALAGLHGSRQARRVAAIAGALVFALTCLVVTLGRPAAFRLGRQAPVSILRAPELFLPILLAGLSAWALWIFACQRRGANTLLFVVFAIDLILWGHSSGWALSPKPTEPFWHVPETVQALRSFAAQDPASYRILTVPHTFDPAMQPIPPSVSHSTDWVLWTQPDIYMMHDIHNAAGYDGFGLARYSRLAGEMKVWGELTDPDSTLRGESRAMDILNVRYLLAMRQQRILTNLIQPTSRDWPPATVAYGGFTFADNDLSVPNVDATKSLRFKVPSVAVDQLALVTNLSWSEAVPDRATVARVTLKAADGVMFEFKLQAGNHTAEWAYDRPDIRARIKHSRPPIAGSYKVSDTVFNYEGHNYVSSFALPKNVEITEGEIVVEGSAKWKDLLLSVFRISLINSDAHQTYPLRREWIEVESRSARATSKQPTVNARWKLLAQTPYVDIYENGHVLPRVWLASSELVLSEEEELNVIRTGKRPDGETWNPLQTALVEAPTGANLVALTPPQGSAVLERHQPNRIEVTTTLSAPAILVTSENYYPGWRSYVDGNAVQTLRVNYNQRGVVLPAGQHRVVFVYRPKTVLLGLAISLLSLIALIFWSKRLIPEGKLRRLAVGFGDRSGRDEEIDLRKAA